MGDRRQHAFVLMYPADLPLMRDPALLAVQVLRQGGLNLDVQPMHWATLVQRRAKRKSHAHSVGSKRGLT